MRDYTVLLAVERFVFGEEIGVADRILKKQGLRADPSEMFDDPLKRDQRLPNERKSLHFGCRWHNVTQEL